MRKLDKSQVQWIINEKQKGIANRSISETWEYTPAGSKL